MKRGTDTLSHVAAACGGLELPVLAALGLGNIPGVSGVPAADAPRACFGRMAEAGAGKDSTAGHWELAGLVVERPFPTYPAGFPRDLIEAFERAIGRATLGNIAASGTEIISRLGREHMETGRPIVYTSADSVFQIAAHESVIPPAELYSICAAARELLRGGHAVARVIARPFEGEPGRFVRTAGRRDFSLPPHGPTLLTRASEAGCGVLAIGKVFDLYAGAGVTEHQPSKGNARTMELLTRAVEDGGGDSGDRSNGCGDRNNGCGFIIANLVDFDMLYGHRNDPAGFARALEEFDRDLPGLLDRLAPDDLLLITADHGNDPTTPGTDHTREYVPLLATGPAFAAGRDLGTRATFADAGATCAEHLGLPPLEAGHSFLAEMTP